LYACGFRICFTPLPGFFSPFPHGTGSLSVDYEYLALEDGPPIFRQDFSCPALLVATSVPRSRFRIRGYHPLGPAFPDRFASSNAKSCKAPPISLATTFGISVDFCSSAYLDVSVQQVRSLKPMYSARCDPQQMVLHPADLADPLRRLLFLKSFEPKPFRSSHTNARLLFLKGF
jgi:hypothetical protein